MWKNQNVMVLEGGSVGQKLQSLGIFPLALLRCIQLESRAG